MAEVEQAIEAAHAAYRATRGWEGERFAKFLERYAELIEAASGELVAMAHAETLCPSNRGSQSGVAEDGQPTPTSGRRGAWRCWMHPIIDRANSIRACFAPIGPVCVFGPNNFPFAFNGIAGGDFAAAVALATRSSRKPIRLIRDQPVVRRSGPTSRRRHRNAAGFCASPVSDRTRGR